MQTIWGQTLQSDRVLQEYPRPQMKRQSYVNLNGLWQYAIRRSEDHPETWDGEILVPFSPEAPLSGVSRSLQPDEYLWYRRTLELPKQMGTRWLLHFGAVDQLAAVYVNGEALATHTGGYTAFTVDVTDSLRDGENLLTVRVRDETEESPLARGKQKTNRGGIWYTPQSGIWQTVWAEQVPAVHIQHLRIVPRFDDSLVEITAESEVEDDCTIEFDGETYAGQTNVPIQVPVPMFRPWSPESPVLYDFTAVLGQDRVESYFAMRKVEVCRDEYGVPRIHLNGRPYFMHGVLDQGYWPDGLYTAPSDEALCYDIQAMKDLGFNTLRKHVKVEPMRWYYHCDRLGMLVWQDMPNGGAADYKFSIATLPLFTRHHRADSAYTAFGRLNGKGCKQFQKELTSLVKQLRNVPSLVLWTPFNEGWGQFDARETADLIRSLDPDRLIDHASGWHDQGAGDVDSHHVYFYRYRYQPDRKGRAVILSEYGGYQLRLPDHTWGKKSFGYRGQKNQEGLLRAYEALQLEQVLPAMEKGLSAAIYTQVSDVEDELNGLLTYDRAVQKLSASAIRNINLQITAFNQRR